jgi:hypothetical protein
VEVEQFPGVSLWRDKTGAGEVSGMALEIRRRPVESFAAVESPLIRKVRE